MKRLKRLNSSIEGFQNKDKTKKKFSFNFKKIKTNKTENISIDNASSVDLKKPNKKKLIIAGSIVGVVLIGIGANSLLFGGKEAFLKEYNKATTDIKNKNSAGYAKAFEIFSDIEADGKATPQDNYYIGYIYQYGLGTSKNYTKAYRHYKLAANTGNVLALRQLAIMYADGHGVNKDYDKSIEYLTQAYNKGDTQSIYTIAEIYDIDQNAINNNDKLLFKLYDLNQDNKIKLNPTAKEILFKTCINKNYEPALIAQATEYSHLGKTEKAMIAWQNLANSNNPKTKALAKENIQQLVSTQDTTKQINKSGAETETSKAPEENIEAIKVTTDTVQNAPITEQKQSIAPTTPTTNINPKPTAPSSITKIQNDTNVSPTVKDIVKYSSGDVIDNVTNGTTSLQTSKKILTNILNSKKPAKLGVDINTIVASAQKTITEDTKISELNTKQKEHENNMLRARVEATKEDNYRQLYVLEQKAKTGNAVAEYELGEYYLAQEEYNIALELFTTSAESGYAPASYKLANMYYSDDEPAVKYDKERAIKYYKMAAKGGIKNAEMILKLID